MQKITKQTKVIFILTVLMLITTMSACDDNNHESSGVVAETWTDPTTNLTWQVTPTGGYMSWDEAISHCDNLKIAGGGWRLPTISELRSLIRGCEETMIGGACKVSDDCTDWSCNDDNCDGCANLQGSGVDGAYWPTGVQGDYGHFYYSSTPVLGYGSYDYIGWVVEFAHGYFSYAPYGPDGNYAWARCVR